MNHLHTVLKRSFIINQSLDNSMKEKERGGWKKKRKNSIGAIRYEKELLQKNVLLMESVLFL